MANTHQRATQLTNLAEILEIVRQLPRQAPPSSEPNLISVLSILRETLEKTANKIIVMSSYEKHGGGGADTQIFIDEYDRLERQRDALKDALQRLEAVS